MATFARTHGDVGTVGTFTSFIGKTVNAFGIAVKTGGNAALDISTTEMGVGNAVQLILQAIATNVTVLAYQVENANAGYMSVLTEGDAWTASTMQTTLRALGNIGNTPADVSLTTVTNTGLKLATS